jgi:hypothetical protein
MNPCACVYDIHLIHIRIHNYRLSSTSKMREDTAANIVLLCVIGYCLMACVYGIVEIHGGDVRKGFACLAVGILPAIFMAVLEAEEYRVREVMRLYRLRVHRD